VTYDGVFDTPGAVRVDVPLAAPQGFRFDPDALGHLEQVQQVPMSGLLVGAHHQGQAVRPDLLALEHLLEQPDQDILEWLVPGTTDPPPSEMRRIVTRIRAQALGRP